MTSKQREAKERAQHNYTFPFSKEEQIKAFVHYMGYDTSLVTFPRTWREAIERFK